MSGTLRIFSMSEEFRAFRGGAVDKGGTYFRAVGAGQRRKLGTEEKE